MDLSTVTNVTIDAVNYHASDMYSRIPGKFQSFPSGPFFRRLGVGFLGCFLVVVLGVVSIVFGCFPGVFEFVALAIAHVAHLEIVLG